MRREVHFLAKYAAHVRGETLPSDPVAETYFPFISSQRFTLVEFAREPRRWFWFTAEWPAWWGADETSDSSN